MALISISTDAGGLAKKFGDLGERGIKQARTRAINKVADRVWTANKRMISKETGLPQYILARRMKKFRARVTGNGASLVYELKGIPFAQMAQLVTQTKQGVIVGKKLFKGMFLAQVAGGRRTKGASGAMEGSGGHVGVFVRHDKANKRRGARRTVRETRKFTGEKNKSPGVKYRPGLAIKEPLKMLTYLIPMIERQSYQTVSTQFPKLFEHELQWQMNRLGMNRLGR